MLCLASAISWLYLKLYISHSSCKHIHLIRFGEVFPLSFLSCFKQMITFCFTQHMHRPYRVENKYGREKSTWILYIYYWILYVIPCNTEIFCFLFIYEKTILLFVIPTLKKIYMSTLLFCYPPSNLIQNISENNTHGTFWWYLSSLSYKLQFILQIKYPYTLHEIQLLSDSTNQKLLSRIFFLAIAMMNQ